MEIDALVCDHAEVADGKLFINGAGITVSWVAPQAPHVIGVSLAAVQQLLGHSTVVMTQRYARIDDAMVKREVERAVSSGRL